MGLINLKGNENPILSGNVKELGRGKSMAQPTSFLVFTRLLYCPKGKKRQNNQIKEAKYIWPPQLVRVCKACEGWQEIICLSHRATKWSKCFYPPTWELRAGSSFILEKGIKRRTCREFLQFFKIFNYSLSEESVNFQLVVPDR